MHMNTFKPLPKQSSDQSGIVSIMVTIILMAVMTLIVLGFAEVARHDQREALDRQLSNQAFYAAESGVNDAQHIIVNDINANTIPPDKTTCGIDSTYEPTANSNIVDINDAIPNVRYTCLLVNTTPPSLAYPLSTQGTSQVFPIDGVDSAGNAQTVTSVQLKWQSTGSDTAPAANCPTSTGTLPPATSWTCGYGLLRVDLVPITSVTRSSLMQNDFTAFLVPIKAGSGAVSYQGNGQNVELGSANQGTMVAANCDNTQCTATIDTSSINSSKYYMRVSTVYQDASLQIYANGASGALNLANAQALLDSTGQAQDVLRRIQVRVPMSSSGGLFSDFALETTDSICKQIVALPSGSTDSCPGVDPGGSNPRCIPSPNDIALVLDNSHSMFRVKWGSGNERQEVVKVANNFVQNTNVGVVNEEAVVGFNKVATPYLASGQAQAMTNNVGNLLSDISSYGSFNPAKSSPAYSNWFNTWYVINNNTALPVAKQVLDSDSVRTGLGVQKVMIFLSDGVANDTGLSQAQLKTKIDNYISDNLNDVKIFTIGINNNPNQLNILSDMPKFGAAGGEYLAANNTSDLENLINNIASGFNCVGP